MPKNNPKVTVKVTNRSGFDKSHRSSGTLSCGTITPLLFDEVIPNSKVSLKLNLAAQLPPLVSDTYMNCKLRAEAFFIPMRLLSKSFEDWFNDNGPDALNAGGDQPSDFWWSSRKPALPVLEISAQDFEHSSISFNELAGPGTLLDFLGFRKNGLAGTSAPRTAISMLPMEAYHLVWSEWYRNPRVQRPAFAPLSNLAASSLSNSGYGTPVASMPYNYYDYDDVNNYVYSINDQATSMSPLNCADGVPIYSLRQRNFGLDYFTGSRLDPQQGNKSGVVVPPAGQEMTIAAIRLANSIQLFRERNNIASPRFQDQLKARYNADLSDGVAQRSICLGSAVYDLSTRGIDQTSPERGGDGVNPFSGVAAQYGRAYAAGSDFIISNFTANEPGYILVNVTVVPEVTYTFGASPLFGRYVGPGSLVNMANPLLQNVGDQPIYADELSSKVYDKSSAPYIFGYTDRYSDFMFIPNQVHGNFRDDQNMHSFVLQRSFDNVDSVFLSSAFLQIPKDYLDQILTTNAGVSGLAAWYDCMLDYKVSMPLAEYSIPSLQDPGAEHGQSVSLRRNGSIF